MLGECFGECFGEITSSAATNTPAMRPGPARVRKAVRKIGERAALNCSKSLRIHHNREVRPDLANQLSIDGQSTAEIMRAIDQEQLLGTVQHTTRLMPLGLSLRVII